MEEGGRVRYMFQDLGGDDDIVALVRRRQAADLALTELSIRIGIHPARRLDRVLSMSTPVIR